MENIKTVTLMELIEPQSPHISPAWKGVFHLRAPKSGGSEITCLGREFYPGLEVKFGGVNASTLRYYSEEYMLCILPPAAESDVVEVSCDCPTAETDPLEWRLLAHFRYRDDDEAHILMLALTYLNEKLTGQTEDAPDVVRKIFNLPVPENSREKGGLSSPDDAYWIQTSLSASASWNAELLLEEPIPISGTGMDVTSTYGSHIDSCATS